MAYTNFPNGLTSFGVPVLPLASDVAVGTIYFVSSVTGSNSYEGTEVTRPLATLDYAIGLCNANKGDVIYLLPNHAETVSAASGITVDIAGISIIGLGNGDDRPTFTFSATTSTIVISAAGVVVKNIVTVPSIDSVVSPIVVSGADVTLDYEHRDASSTVEAVRAILTTATADRLNVKLKYIGNTSGNACVNAVRLVGGDNARVHVDFYGVASTAVVEFLTTACTNVVVSGYMYNSGTTDGSKNVIDTVTGSTWYADIVDGAAGATFTGGSASALASDDVSAISSTIGTVNSTTTDSLHGKIGTDTEMADTSLFDMLGADSQTDAISAALYGAAGIATYPASAAAGNGVSMSEVLRYVQDRVAASMLNRNSTNYFSVTADFTSATWNTAAAHEIATVTGAVHMIILPEVTDTVTSAGGTATLVLGDETTDNSLIASTDAENLATGEWWFDATDTRTLASKSIFEKTDFVVANGKDIGYTIGTEALTGGSIVFHVWWEPINATGSVAAGAGGAL